MANGHVKIHDPFSDHNGGPDLDPDSPSDSDGVEDSVEFRILMAYAKRRRPQKDPPPQNGPALLSGGRDENGSSPRQTPEKTEEGEEEEEKKRRKRRRMSVKGLRRVIFKCIRPQTDDEDLPQQDAPRPDVEDRCGPLIPAVEEKEEEEEEEEEKEDKLKETAHRLTKLADQIPFLLPETDVVTNVVTDVETDAPDDEDGNKDVEKMIGLLLRGAGDRLNEAELKDASIATDLFLNYGFFKLLMTTLLTRMDLRSRNPDSPGPKASPKTQIAVACEVTSRLSAVSSLPRNRLLHHGARYLQHYYSPWALQQGGYEEAFYSDDEDDDQ